MNKFLLACILLACTGCSYTSQPTKIGLDTPLFEAGIYCGVYFEIYGMTNWAMFRNEDNSKNREKKEIKFTND